MIPAVNRSFNGYIFDLDGTIWLTERLIPGAQDTVHSLRARNRKILFLTNNSDGTRDMFANQLSSMGIPAAGKDIICTANVMASYLSAVAPGCRCYVIGADPLREELCQAGLLLRDRPGDIDYVVLGIDRDISYRKLQTAFAAIRAGAQFVATNPDPYVPTAAGELIDIGAFIAALETASSHQLDMMVGKPNPLIVEIALKTIGESPHDCLMIGDQLGTDVLAGRRAGVPTALFLRDPQVQDELAETPEPPDYLLELLTDLLLI